MKVWLFDGNLFEGAHVCKQNFMDCARFMATELVSNACVSNIMSKCYGLCSIDDNRAGQ